MDFAVAMGTIICAVEFVVVVPCVLIFVLEVLVCRIVAVFICVIQYDAKCLYNNALWIAASGPEGEWYLHWHEWWMTDTELQNYEFVTFVVKVTMVTVVAISTELIYNWYTINVLLECNSTMRDVYEGKTMHVHLASHSKSSKANSTFLRHLMLILLCILSPKYWLQTWICPPKPLLLWSSFMP